MSGNERGRGVQVVSVGEMGSYRMCAESLRDMATRDELRSLPVAVISMAGATRGGKSFLLDFFLRYLTASASARSDGSWLGGENEPLGGFSWRGGCERDTDGIQLWSEPFVLTRGNGDKVVVLLMDTQGTFDSCSTLQDSTTIFAMSTLLSSVQIFNLSMNIQEDHLQYLQLFTEYGKLASEQSGTPFQVLQFLVRDWSYAYQHPIGALGGQQLLEKRLEIEDSQPEELKEIRQHIHSCFETVRCFLMPHPGLTVATSPNFTGCLADISKEFKDALLELVQGLFGENLTLKKIGGQEIKLHELEQYFESYIEIFNSDQLPTPVTILKATSSACLEAALGAAREVYVASMERSSSEARSVPRDVIPRLHARAKDAARQAFLARRTLAAPERAADRLDRLLKELDDLLANYVLLNQAKVQAAVAASKAAYEKHMLNVAECLLPSELEERHREAVDLAVDLFDSSKLPLDALDEGLQDEDRKDLQQELANFMECNENIIQRNEAKISATIAAAEQKYKEGICQNHVLSSICLHTNHLIALHRTAKSEAIALFESRWKRPESAQNEHRTSLLREISERYLEITHINESNNEKAVQMAIRFYENSMMYDVLGTDLCLHPLDLQSEHKTLYESTINEFYSSRTYGNEGSGRDNYKLKLIQELPTCLTRCINLNEIKNKEAVKAAYEFYKFRMNIGRAHGVLEFLGIPDFNVFNQHREVKPQAIYKFKNELRRAGPDHEEDVHLSELNKLIDVSYSWLILKFASIFSINLGSIMFFRRFF